MREDLAMKLCVNRDSQMEWTAALGTLCTMVLVGIEESYKVVQ
jgi:hypothetical protein